MKKTILALLFAAAVAAVAVVACKKEETDADKGKKDGKAACDCMRNAKTEADEEACEKIGNPNGSQEYLAAYIAAVITNCPDLLGGDEEGEPSVE